MYSVSCHLLQHTHVPSVLYHTRASSTPLVIALAATNIPSIALIVLSSPSIRDRIVPTTPFRHQQSHHTRCIQRIIRRDSSTGCSKEHQDRSFRRMRRSQRAVRSQWTGDQQVDQEGMQHYTRCSCCRRAERHCSNESITFRPRTLKDNGS